MIMCPESRGSIICRKEKINTIKRFCWWRSCCPLTSQEEWNLGECSWNVRSWLHENQSVNPARVATTTTTTCESSLMRSDATRSRIIHGKKAKGKETWKWELSPDLPVGSLNANSGRKFYECEIRMLQNLDEQKHIPDVSKQQTNNKMCFSRVP